jgi:hypothetical protein
MEQPDPTQIKSVVGTVSDPTTVAGLSGTSETFDLYLGLVGAESLAEILQVCLPALLEDDPHLLATVIQTLEAQLGQRIDTWPEHVRHNAASLLGETLRNSTAVLEEINRSLKEAVQENITSSRGKEESNFWTQVEDQQHEDLLKREFAEVEGQMFYLLKRRLETCQSASSKDEIEGGSQSSLSTIIPTRIRAQAIERGLFVPRSQREQDFSKNLWRLLMNGTEKQALNYIYANADKIADDTKRKLLLGLISDQQIPVTWRKALIRAFTANNNNCRE